MEQKPGAAVPPETAEILPTLEPGARPRLVPPEPVTTAVAVVP